MDGLVVQVEPSKIAAAKFDLTFVPPAADRPQRFAPRLSGTIEYATDLFEAGTAAGLVERFTRLLTTVVDEPDCVVTKVDLRTERERDQLRRWNDTKYPANRLHRNDDLRKAGGQHVRRRPLWSAAKSVLVPGN